ncbi:MAG: hypothetical protein SGPRY_001329 [Prymnesium sp.]
MWAVAASCWFYAENEANPALPSWFSPAYATWLVAAALLVLALRLGAILLRGRDVYSYVAFGRALREQTAVNPSRQHEDALYRNAHAQGNGAAMAPTRRRVQMIASAVFHGINALLVGIRHIEDGITASSALSQIPSIYLAVFYIARALCFPPRLPSVTTIEES